MNTPSVDVYGGRSPRDIAIYSVPPADPQRGLSFINLLELHVLGAIRRQHLRSRGQSLPASGRPDSGTDSIAGAPRHG